MFHGFGEREMGFDRSALPGGAEWGGRCERPAHFADASQPTPLPPLWQGVWAERSAKRERSAAAVDGGGKRPQARWRSVIARSRFCFLLRADAERARGRAGGAGPGKPAFCRAR